MNPKIPSPMLATDFDPDRLQYPLFVSPKLDGIRAHIYNGTLLSRSGKPIRNAFTQRELGLYQLTGLDGELIVGVANDKNVMQATSSGVMSTDGEPDVTLWVFDDWNNPEAGYKERHAAVIQRVTEFRRNCIERNEKCRIEVLPQKLIYSAAELETHEEEVLAAGFEGVMLRPLGGRYKFGRVTLNEGYLLKVKRFAHEEAIIIGVEEMMHNDNEAFMDELGRTKRSSAKDGKRGANRLGAFVVKSPLYEKPFNVSCGSMTMEQREQAWRVKDQYIGLLLRFKHLPHGVKDVPRHPLFDGFRDRDDMS